MQRIPYTPARCTHGTLTRPVLFGSPATRHDRDQVVFSKLVFLPGPYNYWLPFLPWPPNVCTCRLKGCEPWPEPPAYLAFSGLVLGQPMPDWIFRYRRSLAPYYADSQIYRDSFITFIHDGLGLSTRSDSGGHVEWIENWGATLRLVASCANVCRG